MKHSCFLVFAFLILLANPACTTTSTTDKYGNAIKKLPTKRIYVALFQCKCPDDTVRLAIQNSIYEKLMLAKQKVAFLPEQSDIVINGTITFSDDAYSSAGVYGKVGASSSSYGQYASGITTKLLDTKSSELLAIVSVTQSRSNGQSIVAPEALAHKIGGKISRIIKYKKYKNKD